MTWQLTADSPLSATLTLAWSQRGAMHEVSLDANGHGWLAGRMRAGDLVSMRPRVIVLGQAEAGPSRLDAAWNSGGTDGARIFLGTVQVLALPPPLTRACHTMPRRGTCDSQARLVSGHGRGQRRWPHLVGHFHGVLARRHRGNGDLTVLVHLVDAGGKMVAQADSRPAAGSRPTTGWRADEIIADRHVLTVPAIAPGEYRLLVGLYLSRDAGFARIPAFGEDGVRLPDGRAEVARWTVGGP